MIWLTFVCQSEEGINANSEDSISHNEATLEEGVVGLFQNPIVDLKIHLSLNTQTPI